MFGSALALGGTSCKDIPFSIPWGDCLFSARRQPAQTRFKPLPIFSQHGRGRDLRSVITLDGTAPRLACPSPIAALASSAGTATTIAPDAPESAASVQAEIGYLKRTGPGKPRLYVGKSPPPGEPAKNYGREPFLMDILNIRHMKDPPQLDRNGFELVAIDSKKVHDFYNDDEVKGVLYPEIEKVIKRTTGASRVVFIEHRRRRRMDGLEKGQINNGVTGVFNQPVIQCHVDYSEAGGAARVLDFAEEADKAMPMQRRAILNFWMPIRGPLVDSPLAICDPQSLSPQDIHAVETHVNGRSSELYMFTHGPSHKWHYASDMNSTEAYVFKSYDSNKTVAPFAPHCAFYHPLSPHNAAPRESFECRTALFWS